MSDSERYLAIDLGAESGRAILGRLIEGRVELEEVHRFANGPKDAGGRLYWDVLYLWEEIKKGLGIAGVKAKGRLASVGVDAWGVDFALIDRRGELLGNPVHYRDRRTDRIFETAFKMVPREKIFQSTGIQFLQFNTLFQLLAMRLAGSPLVEAAERLLMMPDLFHFWLSGNASQEFTNATTTQCYDTRKGDWAWDLLDAFIIPKRLFQEVSAPGKILDDLHPTIAEELDLEGVRIALPATHDTASAIAAIPAEGASWGYVSCGTWSLVGSETRKPVINAQGLQYNFTNEGGAFGTNLLLCNVMGLWLLQRARAAWSAEGRDLDYTQIAEAARRAPGFAAWVDPDDAGFLNPPDMNRAIAEFCVRTGQEPPVGVGPVARCIFESLAMKYRFKIDRVERLLGRRLDVIHVVGGGSRNSLLCQATADALARPVIAGPAEAAAIGNLLMQAVAAGRLSSAEELRSIVRRSISLTRYEPAEPERWEEPYGRFLDSIEN